MPPRTSLRDASADRPQEDGAVAARASISWAVFTSRQRWKVEITPTPAFTAPSPRGNTQP